MKKKIKSFGFWTALAGALTILVEALGKCFGFTVEEGLVSEIVLAVAGVLVVLGVVCMPSKEDKPQDTQEVEDDEKSEEPSADEPTNDNSEE